MKTRTCPCGSTYPDHLPRCPQCGQEPRHTLPPTVQHHPSPTPTVIVQPAPFSRVSPEALMQSLGNGARAHALRQLLPNVFKDSKGK